MAKLTLSPEDFLGSQDFENIAYTAHGRIIDASAEGVIIEARNSTGADIQIGFVPGETIMSTVIESALEQ